MFSIAVVLGLVVKRRGTGEPSSLAMLPASLRLSPNATTLVKSVAWAAAENSSAVVTAAARGRRRGMRGTPGRAVLENRYVNATHTEAHVALRHKKSPVSTKEKPAFAGSSTCHGWSRL